MALIERKWRLRIGESHPNNIEMHKAIYFYIVHCSSMDVRANDSDDEC